MTFGWGVRCPRCDGRDNRVVDSRDSRGGRAVRRRRECADCEHRFTTYEYLAERTPQVLKRSGAAEDFDRVKLLRGVQVACAKRPVSPSDMEQLADDIEDRVSRKANPELSSREIGAMVMGGLRALDRVAYVRFASVYRNFQGTGEFEEIVGEMARDLRREAVAHNQAELPLTPSTDPSERPPTDEPS